MVASTREQHGTAEPSSWVRRWADRVPQAGTVLDVACGHGRHARFFAARGCRVHAVDRDEAAIAALSAVPGIVPVCADLESGPWPFAGERFEAVVVANYLHRPLMPLLLDAVAPGGVLIYETFAAGHERYGRPRNPDHLLRPGELLEGVRGWLRVLAYEDVDTGDACIQRICAAREAPVAA